MICQLIIKNIRPTGTNSGSKFSIALSIDANGRVVGFRITQRVIGITRVSGGHGR